MTNPGRFFSPDCQNGSGPNRYGRQYWNCPWAPHETVMATHLLIERWKAEGYEFVTVPEMMAGDAVVGRPSSVVG